jgi:hypothetical protein
MGFRIINSTAVPADEKNVFVMPLVLVVALCIIGLFEDVINGVGRGSIAGYIFWLSLMLCGTQAMRLAEQYDIDASKVGDKPLVKPVMPPRAGQVLRQVD